jgi:sigma-B regulation protein RsbU (phosphoserine phosphatase)
VDARVQQTLLPSLDFSPAGWDVRYHYAPAGVFGGDYCDLVESKDGLLFLFGDVCGKGVAASMLMSHLHATFRSLADRNLSLDVMVEAANRNFVGRAVGSQFATLVAGLAAADGSVDFVNAGHLPLLPAFPSAWLRMFVSHLVAFRSIPETRCSFRQTA